MNWAAIGHVRSTSSWYVPAAGRLGLRARGQADRSLLALDLPTFYDAVQVRPPVQIAASLKVTFFTTGIEIRRVAFFYDR